MKEIIMQQGTISRLNHSRGFGFLTTSDGEDLFFHRTNVHETPFARLQVGDRVTYDVQTAPRGTRADKVQLNMPASQLQINLAVRDMDRAVQFYVSNLGFKKIVMNPGYVLLHRGALIIGLKTDELLWHPAVVDHNPKDLVRGVGIELVLEVSDIEHYYTQIQQSGITFQEPLVDRPWGAKDFRILDSEGYYWRVTSPRPLAHPEDDHSNDTSGYQPGDALYDTSAPTASQSSGDEDGN
ncbi:uncharacterized protein METZ01_LOCUS139506 [marine metagenome]|uniref:CSD domain-containing protein n=1 Tax=marine metagenome TaxID=408172 RepID=A0A381ZCS2_9ZZZZ